MAKYIPILQERTFMLRMDDEEMQELTEMTQRYKVNYPDMVLACFHAGFEYMQKRRECPRH